MGYKVSIHCENFGVYQIIHKEHYSCIISNIEEKTSTFHMPTEDHPL